MEFTIESCLRGNHFSKEFCTSEVGEEFACLSTEEGDPNDVYTVAVKTDTMKTVQSKRNNDLLSFQLHFVITSVVTNPKLAHSLVKFPVRLISHFVMNIIMAKTGSTAKVNDIFSAIRQGIFPLKFPAIRYAGT